MLLRKMAIVFPDLDYVFCYFSYAHIPSAAIISVVNNEVEMENATTCNSMNESEEAKGS